MSENLITVITPTKGGVRLLNLINSLQKQDVPYRHLLLWDDKRDDLPWDFENESAIGPEQLEKEYKEINSIVIKGCMVQGAAAGSALRAVGLMVANTPFVTFADEDVWFEKNHLSNMLKTIQDNKAHWGYCVRRIWSPYGDYIGKDLFESVGDSTCRKTPYEMVDNSSMMFSRRFGTSAACLYRETVDYNDDRLMYAFLKKYAGKPAIKLDATVNQVCPEQLIGFFEKNCIKD